MEHHAIANIFYFCWKMLLPIMRILWFYLFNCFLFITALGNFPIQGVCLVVGIVLIGTGVQVFIHFGNCIIEDFSGPEIFRENAVKFYIVKRWKWPRTSYELSGKEIEAVLLLWCCLPYGGCTKQSHYWKNQINQMGPIILINLISAFQNGMRLAVFLFLVWDLIVKR